MRSPLVLTTRAELAAWDRGVGRDPALERGAVLTMGALHAGHESLVRLVRGRVGEDAPLVVTVFVNPLQFAAHEDLERYPRDLDGDAEAAGRAGADVVWAPSVDEVYPAGPPRVTVSPGRSAGELEGAVRPTHFAGVLTVVAKMFGLLRPQVTAFGEKDYQQLALVRRMVTDLELAVDVLGAPTVREDDGLALSSRNAYLDADQRLQARALSAALRAGAACGPAGAAAVLAAARSVLDGLDVDYLELRAPDLGPAPVDGEARLLVAARFGATRLIDNVSVRLGG